MSPTFLCFITLGCRREIASGGELPSPTTAATPQAPAGRGSCWTPPLSTLTISASRAGATPAHRLQSPEAAPFPRPRGRPSWSFQVFLPVGRLDASCPVPGPDRVSPVCASLACSLSLSLPFMLPSLSLFLLHASSVVLLCLCLSRPLFSFISSRT